MNSFVDQEKLRMVLSDPALLFVVAVVPAVFTFVMTAIFLAPKKDKKPKKDPVINTAVKKENPKVVDTIDCGELDKVVEYKDGKVVMCRCWKSSTFPYCDGKHNKHNQDTGDNIGPLIIKGK